jgi:hypothetical protein
MATTATPTGAEPTDTLSASGSFTGKVRHIKIASAYDTAIFYGDFVQIVSSGTVEKAAVTTSVAAGIVGIFVGCTYTDPNSSQMTFSQQWTVQWLQTLMRMLLMILNCYFACKLTKQLPKLDLETMSQR